MSRVEYISEGIERLSEEFKAFSRADNYVLIVDFNHLVHKFSNAMRETRLNTPIEVNGRVELIDTAVSSTLLKSLVSLTGYGRAYLAVCADSKQWSRKIYFKEKIEDGTIWAKDGAYKEGRAGIGYDFISSSEMIKNLLLKSGATVYQQENYEADDIISDCVRKAKVEHPNLPIFILTGDMDMVPLVDEQVSVYLYTRKVQQAYEGFPVFNNYVQVTPYNYMSVLEARSSVKTLLGITDKNRDTTTGYLRYNSLVLAKLIRGDKSDNINPLLDNTYFESKGTKKGVTPKFYRQLVEHLYKRGIDISIFRYHPWLKTYVDTDTGKHYDELPASYYDEPTELRKRHWKQSIKENPKVEEMFGYLTLYFDEHEMAELKARYEVMNLNSAFLNTKSSSDRRPPIRLSDKKPITRLNVYQLAQEASKFQINIKLR